MKFTKIYLILFAFFIGYSIDGNAQVNYGVITGGDWYQRFVNPIDDTGTERSSGSAVLNSVIGPKIWLGNPKFSFSVESYANLASFAYNKGNSYGKGALSIPVIAKLNFKGMSGFTELNKFGYYVGFGYQYNKTEFWGLNDKAIALGVQRDYFGLYVVEVGLGKGAKNKVTEYFVRYGYDKNTSSSAFHVGVNATYSIPHFKVPNFNQGPKKKKEDDEIIRM